MDIENKNVVVFGAGISGVSACKLLLHKKANVFMVSKGEKESWSGWTELEKLTDQMPEGHFVSQDNSYSIFEKADLVILSPGIPRDSKVLEIVHHRKISIISEIELGYWFCDKPIIAITGTNGKTTTTTLMGDALKRCKKKVFIGGNIGIPFCDLLLYDDYKDYDYVVLEVSSFQLESIDKFRPKLAIILNISMNHGERYSNLNDYANAKFQMTKNMGEEDFLIYPEDDIFIEQWAETQNLKKFGFDRVEIHKQTEDKFDLSSFSLKGEHNLENLYVVQKTFSVLGFGKEGERAIQDSINTFQGVPFRLELLNTPDLKFSVYNDSKSTNFQSVLTALKAIYSSENENPIILILGGQKRGENNSISDYLDFLRAHVSMIFLIGESASDLEKELEGVIPMKNILNIENVMDFIPDDFRGTLLFSPGFPSFDQFKNYVERGNAFRTIFNPS